MYTHMYELSFLFVVDRRVIKHYLRRIKREVKYAKNFVLMIPPKKLTPEWTIPFNQSELQTGWDATGCTYAAPAIRGQFDSSGAV